MIGKRMGVTGWAGFLGSYICCMRHWDTMSQRLSAFLQGYF